MRIIPVSLKYTYELVPLGRNFFWRVKILFFWIVLFIKRHLGISTRTAWFFKLKHKELPFYFYLKDEIDVQSFVGVFLRGEYDMRVSREPQVIVDLGSNIGTSILYFKLLYPNATIYGFEPNPKIFPLLKLNMSQFSNIFLYNYAVSDIAGKAKLYINKLKNSASSIVGMGGDFVVVPAISLKEVKEIVGDTIDLLKFDVEGAEEKIFSGHVLEGINNFIGEVHLGLMNMSEDDFVTLFDKYIVDIERRDKIYFILRAKKNEKNPHAV